MKNIPNIESKARKLKSKYMLLIEGAYNFQETDDEISDIYAYDALKLLNEINRLKYLARGYISAFS